MNLLQNVTFKVALVILVGLVSFTNVTHAAVIETASTSNSTVTTNGTNTTTVKSPPPSAISPGINASNSDLCTVGVSGAVQTQILGISGGNTVRDMNCERLKLSKTIYDMGMKVAAVSVMCQDQRIFDAMEMAGTPCPFLGAIGTEAQEQWDRKPELQPANIKENEKDDNFKTIGGILLFLLFLI
tara:strand:+ start:2333 stop:2887 length:555 start_codon:yes stop_codon:yes gene_type:complete